MRQDRNQNVTESHATTDSYASLSAAIATSTANFVGLDNFYYSARDLGFSNPTGLTASEFKSALETKCNGTVTGSRQVVNEYAPLGALFIFTYPKAYPRIFA